ncbi:uncharacterized protein LOC141524140 isoform X2 [Cotesia typhae]|uniref:uncharacterized protein LOC141524140 isoform X2 n=1 Tax=Cotesia typhae TaxID=2053667 RepID=UPI003D68809F
MKLTFNHECPSYIQLHMVQKNGEYVLEIFNTNFNHLNHPANSKQLANALPERRRLPPELKEEVIEYIRLKSKPKMIRNKIRDQYGILLTSKDISNITQSERSLDGNNLRTFQQLLHDKYGCITKVKASDRNEFEALFLQILTCKSQSPIGRKFYSLTERTSSST